WNGIGGGRDRDRELSQRGRNRQLRRRKCRDDGRSGFIEQEARANNGHAGFPTSPTAARDRATHRHAVEGSDGGCDWRNGGPGSAIRGGIFRRNISRSWARG